jgi:hypothetical protein
MVKKGTIAGMRAAVAALETTLQATQQRVMTHAELLERELEAQRAWRLQSQQRHIRPQGAK